MGTKKEKTTFKFKRIVLIAFFLGMSTTIFFIYFSKVFSGLYISEWKYYNTKDNLFISCSEEPNLKDNPSLKIIIDNSIILAIDSLSGLKNSKSIRLNKGKHLLKISTLDDKYPISDSINLEDSFIDYRLSITYYNQEKQFSYIFHNLLLE